MMRDEHLSAVHWVNRCQGARSLVSYLVVAEPLRVFWAASKLVAGVAFTAARMDKVAAVVVMTLRILADGMLSVGSRINQH